MNLYAMMDKTILYIDHIKIFQQKKNPVNKLTRTFTLWCMGRSGALSSVMYLRYSNIADKHKYLYKITTKRVLQSNEEPCPNGQEPLRYDEIGVVQNFLEWP